MNDRPKKIGGRREPPGGRPPKGNVKFYCYVKPETVEEIDGIAGRAKLTRGEVVEMAIYHLLNVTPPPRGARGETEG